MAQEVFVSVRELPPCLQRALESVQYGAKDVALVAAETVCLLDPGGQGRKGFAVLVNLETGERKKLEGSWGGANMFNPSNSVDLDRADYTLPPGGAVVQGSIGYPRTFARILLHPTNLVPLLPPKPELSDRQQRIMRMYNGYTSAYRKEELTRMKVTPAEIDDLVAKGLLSRNKAGATQITTAGKNAARDR
jgi:hypothetical protein